MQRLSLSEFAITIIILLAITFGAVYKLRNWLLNVNEQTNRQVSRAGRIYQ